MMTKHKASFTKNAAARKITVIKELDAPLKKYGKHGQQHSNWTNGGAPNHGRQSPKKMDFREGGSWIYKMQGPNGEAQWDKVEFTSIDAPAQFTATDLFIDEKGNKKTDMPSANWKNSFTKTGDRTTIVAELSFASKEDMDKILKTGFEQGFSTGLDQLEELLVH